MPPLPSQGKQQLPTAVGQITFMDKYKVWTEHGAEISLWWQAEAGPTKGRPTKYKKI